MILHFQIIYAHILILSCIQHYASKHKSHKHKYFLKMNICKNISVSTFFLFLSMPYKLDYALKLQKWKAARNCLAIYDEPFHTWWNANYIAHVQKVVIGVR